MTTFPERLGITEASASDTSRPGDDAGRALTVDEKLINVNGGLHGGVIATMLDATMGDAVRAGLEQDQSTVTVSMTITYLEGAKEGDELRSSAEVRKRGGKLVLVEADITRVRDDAAIAHGVGTFTVITD
ncbi:PaaI family thioesterase [Gephyromycinifex aptenodytis]|uniref:PaaI family thioesterase n=1 Tax=Gephyromycinifex aptenodytis TaxID=2716227 RepID=UPI001446653D|nr:PaaI family thioesterase [Gephyromycinifex aptenodytis]